MVNLNLFSVFVLSLVFSLGVQIAKAAPASQNMTVLTGATAFRTHAEFLKLLTATNSISENDLKEASAILAAEGFTLNQLMPAPKIQGDKVFFGKYFLRIRSDGQWASQGGKSLRPAANLSFADTYASNLKVLKAEMPRRASLQNLLLSSAWAIDSDLSPEAQAGQMGWAAMVITGKTALATSQLAVT